LLLVSPWVLGSALQYLWPIQVHPAWPIRVVGMILIAAIGFWRAAKFCRRRYAAENPAAKVDPMSSTATAAGTVKASPKASPLAFYLGSAFLLNWLWPLFTLIPFGFLVYWGITDCDGPRRKW